MIHNRTFRTWHLGTVLHQRQHHLLAYSSDTEPDAKLKIIQLMYHCIPACSYTLPKARATHHWHRPCLTHYNCS
ncbi:hypothetical protein AV530_012224 [Patagioenas fasciata monilis]|uniref:Uncharacterized protein n=1 Tax=Patagioenas fasciata monilis TaxID=372326 RepID=A0A1V4K503_PATFA|nr:hypothetical protein AV530_012224 [Patagioenas fasciata monilis]